MSTSTPDGEGGEAIRYVTRHGAGRIDRIILVEPTGPRMMARDGDPFFAPRGRNAALLSRLLNSGDALMDYDTVLSSILAWADGNDNVRCVVLTGSAASATAHPLSDRDLELHVRETTILEDDDSWWNTLGEVLAVERLKNSDDQSTRIIYYVGGKLDFTLIDIRDESGDYDRPFEILLDKDGDAAQFRVVAPLPASADQNAFNACLNWGYAAALMIAKAIVRDEPWSAKLRDNDLKTEMLWMIEWDHGVRYGGERDVRYLGARIQNEAVDGHRRATETRGLLGLVRSSG